MPPGISGESRFLTEVQVEVLTDYGLSPALRAAVVLADSWRAAIFADEQRAASSEQRAASSA